MARHTHQKTPARRTLIGVAKAVVAVLLVALLYVGVNVALLLADRREISGWKSAEGEAHFYEVYDEIMGLLPQPFETRDLVTDFGTVRAYRFDKPGADAAYRQRTPLLLLPGHGSPTPLWREDIPILMQQRPVWTIDLLGQPGKSVPSRPVRSETDQAAWLHQALTQLGGGSFHLMGLSFGGWTAVNYAIHHPELVSSLSLADPALTFAPPRPSMIIASIPTVFPLVPAAYSDWFVEWTTGEPVDRTDPVFRLVTAGVSSYVVREPTLELPSDAALGSISVPVMVLLGGRSAVHDADAASARARSLLPHPDITIDPDKGHAVNGPRFDAMVLDFLDGQP